jgi:hypothetical protein
MIVSGHRASSFNPVKDHKTGKFMQVGNLYQTIHSDTWIRSQASVAESFVASPGQSTTPEFLKPQETGE